MGNKVKVYGFDLETIGVDPFAPNAAILTGSIVSSKDAISYVLDHPLDEWTSDKEYEARLNHMHTVLGNPSVVISGHNLAAFDVVWWEVVTGRTIEACLFDTRVAYALLDEDNKENSLAFLATKFTKRKKNEEGLDRKALAEIDPEKVLAYNTQDARISRELYAPLRKALTADGQWPLAQFAFELSKVLARMTILGACVDKSWVNKQGKEILKEVERHRKELELVIGEDVNISSPKQLSELLYDYMGLPVMERSFKTHAPSTASDSLKMLLLKATKQQKYVIELLLKFRGANKLWNTYLKPIAEKHRKSDGRIHTTFHLGRGYTYGKQSGTVTGRLSSSTPNLQNMPRDPRVKGAIVASPGYKLFEADYSQLELRVAAWYSQEPEMLRAFKKGEDIHTKTLAISESRKYEEVQALVDGGDKKWIDKRTMIKRVNFGILYGVGPYTLVKRLRDLGVNITQWRAEELISSWLLTYPRVARLMEEWKDEIVKTGRLVTPTGRVRHLPGGSRHTQAGQGVLRQGINFPIQSLASDITLVALLELAKQQLPWFRVMLTVHDSVVGEYRPKDITKKQVVNLVRETMVNRTAEALESRFGVKGIPLAVDINAGSKRWGEAHG